MPKKAAIVSAVSLMLLAALVFTLINIAGARKSGGVPERVSIYDRETGVIYTPTYEDLLCGIVSGMFSVKTQPEPEMLKAAAIAANTRLRYFLSEKSGFDERTLGAQLIVSESIPYDPEEPSDEIRAAAREALNTYLTYENEPFNVPVCNISTGKTDECPPYSPSRALPCDINAAGYESRAEFMPEDVRKALNGGHLSYRFNDWFHDPVYGENGTLLFIELDEERVSGETLKTSLGLRSTAVTVEFAEDSFGFICRGLGNNRGMSLNAANCLAKDGKTAEEILEYFFPTARLVKI